MPPPAGSPLSLMKGSLTEPRGARPEALSPSSQRHPSPTGSPVPPPLSMSAPPSDGAHPRAPPLCTSCDLRGQVAGPCCSDRGLPSGRESGRCSRLGWPRSYPPPSPLHVATSSPVLEPDRHPLPRRRHRGKRAGSWPLADSSSGTQPCPPCLFPLGCSFLQ